MPIELFKKIFGPKSFAVVVKVDGKTAGEALFYERDDEPGVFGERVDIKTNFQGRGLATMALQTGDQIMREEFPEAKRRFNDKRGFPYTRYTDGITDEQIIDIDNDGVVFKP